MMENGDITSVVANSKHIYSSALQGLNEASAEYVVQTIKHFFNNLIIVQYVVQNTLEDHILSKVKLNVDHVESASNLQLKYLVPLDPSEEIKYGDKKSVYAIISKEACEEPFPSAKIHQKLQFYITEIDVDSQEKLGGYDEDYALDDLTLTVKDYIRANPLPNGQFRDLWDSIIGHQNASEMISNFQIPFKSMEEAVSGVIKFFNMSVCDGTDKINVTEKVHNLLLSGLFFGSETVLVRAQIGFNQEYGCVLKIAVRSMNKLISSAVLNCIN